MQYVCKALSVFFINTFDEHLKEFETLKLSSSLNF